MPGIRTGDADVLRITLCRDSWHGNFLSVRLISEHECACGSSHLGPCPCVSTETQLVSCTDVDSRILIYSFRIVRMCFWAGKSFCDAADGFREPVGRAA